MDFLGLVSFYRAGAKKGKPMALVISSDNIVDFELKLTSPYNAGLITLSNNHFEKKSPSILYHLFISFLKLR